MISVVMPAYNASSYIAEAIESILKQTFRDFEFIIIDDGSTDSTVMIAEQYGKQDERIKLIQSEHIGVSRARNLGTKEAKYDWVAVMDADDIALPERFEQQMKAAHSFPEVVAWGTYAHHINSKNEILSLVQQGATTSEEFYELRQDGHIPFVVHPTALLRKEILLKVGGYDQNFPAALDFELLDRMANHGPILAIPEPLLLYRIHSQSISMQKFFLQQMLARYVIARHRAKIAGLPEPDLDEFKEQYEHPPILLGVDRRRRTLGQFWYRKAGLLYAEKSYIQSGFFLSMAISFHPLYSIPRIWNQKFRPVFDKWLSFFQNTDKKAI
ncbi:MAG: glycosyltransferase family 2 protein [Cyanothece sp. SIO1E1]|nr:glycosyltransferase family 2 protein [Cyanothece sp. SIO1E1]